MKKALLLCLALTIPAYSYDQPVGGHDHVEVGLSPTDTNRLALYGPQVQYAVYVPRGEAFSGYATNFPGACFASELTFTTETDVLNSALGADPDIELIAVTGPIEGSFSFWEEGAVEPTWTRPTGWSHSETDTPSFPVVVNGWGHNHGRIFSADHPGDYQVTFRATDKNSQLKISADHTITFRAVKPPPLSIRLHQGQAVISFTSRLNLTYELQICTQLSSGLWSPALSSSINGDGGLKEITLPLTHPRVFFRLVEFK